MDKNRELETTERWKLQRDGYRQRDGNHREMEIKERWIKTERGKNREMDKTERWKPQRDG